MELKGHRGWTRTDSKEGHRTYRIKWLCKGALTDGPQVAINCPGLPALGASWTYGGDSDTFAQRTSEAVATPLQTKEKGYYWTVEHVFTTPGSPDSAAGASGDGGRCQDESIENPLLEPPEISGGFVKYTKEAVETRDGEKLKSSSHEMFRGAAVEFDDNRPTVVITLNVGELPLDDFTPMVDTVNSGGLWGMPARAVKLSGVSWRRLYYGTCSKYYKVTYEFDIRNTPRTGLGFDRKIIDEGTKILSDGGDQNNPADFEVYKDVNGENGRVLLDGAGAPLADGAEPVEILVEYYRESNFLILGIPATL